MGEVSGPGSVKLPIQGASAPQPAHFVTSVPASLPSCVTDASRHARGTQEMAAKREELSQKAIPASMWKRVAGLGGTLVFGAIAVPFAIIPLLFAGVGKFFGWLGGDPTKDAETGWLVGKCAMVGIPFLLFPLAEGSLNWLTTGGAKEAPKVEEVAEPDRIDEDMEKLFQEHDEALQSSDFASELPPAPLPSPLSSQVPPQPAVSEPAVPSREIPEAQVTLQVPFLITEAFLYEAVCDLEKASDRNFTNTLKYIFDSVPTQSQKEVITQVFIRLRDKQIQEKLADHLFNQKIATAKELTNWINESNLLKKKGSLWLP